MVVFYLFAEKEESCDDIVFCGKKNRNLSNLLGGEILPAIGQLKSLPFV
jgi:hypothetical protein